MGIVAVVGADARVDNPEGCCFSLVVFCKRDSGDERKFAAAVNADEVFGWSSSVESRNNLLQLSPVIEIEQNVSSVRDEYVKLSFLCGHTFSEETR